MPNPVTIDTLLPNCQYCVKQLDPNVLQFNWSGDMTLAPELREQITQIIQQTMAHPYQVGFNHQRQLDTDPSA